MSLELIEFVRYHLYVIDGLMYWQTKTKQPINKYCYHCATPSLDVETTAYALSSYMVGPNPYGSKEELQNIVKWLVKQRNSHGGFTSTQVCCNSSTKKK